MIEVSGNIWDWLGKAVIAVTTNGHVTRDGKVALGRGCARQAGEYFPDLKLICRSARELRELADVMGWRRIVVPRPDCGGGGLDWKEVRPVVAEFFDERFFVITMGQT